MSTTDTAITLQLSALSLEPATMAVWFHPDIREYQAWCPPSTESVTLRAASDTPNAIISVAGQTLGPDGSTQLPLSVGMNCMTLTIQTPDLPERRINLRIVRQHAAPDWRHIAAQSPWPARDSAGELVFDGYLWLFGGYIPKVISDVWRSRDGVTWEKMPDIPAADGINIPVRWVFDDCMWVGSREGDLWRSRDGRQWDRVTPRAPWAGRRTAGSVVFDGRMWLLGGADSDDRRNDVWSSRDGVNWTLELEHAPWCPRQLWDNVVVFRDRIWIIGGGVQQYHPAKTFHDVWCATNFSDTPIH